MLLQFSRTLLFSKRHACKSLEVFSSSTFCSSTCLMLKFLVWKCSQVLLYCIHSPAGTGGFLENSTDCWANISMCCSAHLCTQAGIGPTEINRDQSQAVLEITPLQCQWWWLKSAAVFFLGRNWFLSSLGPATKTSAFLHVAEHSHVLWVQHQQLPCAVAVGVRPSTSHRLRTNCRWNFIQRHFLLPSHLSLGHYPLLNSSLL